MRMDELYIRMPKKMKRELAKKAEEDGISTSQAVREAVASHWKIEGTE